MKTDYSPLLIFFDNLILFWHFNRFGYTLAILPLGNRFLPTEKQLFVFERFSQDKIASGTQGPEEFRVNK